MVAGRAPGTALSSLVQASYRPMRVEVLRCGDALDRREGRRPDTATSLAAQPRHVSHRLVEQAHGGPPPEPSVGRPPVREPRREVAPDPTRPEMVGNSGNNRDGRVARGRVGRSTSSTQAASPTTIRSETAFFSLGWWRSR